MSFRACAEANDTELASTRAHQGTDNAVFVAAGGSVGTGIGRCVKRWLFIRMIGSGRRRSQAPAIRQSARHLRAGRRSAVRAFHSRAYAPIQPLCNSAIIAAAISACTAPFLRRKHCLRDRQDQSVSGIFNVRSTRALRRQAGILGRSK